MLYHTLGFQVYRWLHKARRSWWFLCCFRLPITRCTLLTPHVLSLGLSHLTGGCHMQDQLKDPARITSQVNWRYNQHKRKGLVERLQLSNCCKSEICTRTWRIIIHGEKSALNNSFKWCWKFWTSQIPELHLLRKVIFVHPICCHRQKILSNS